MVILVVNITTFVLLRTLKKKSSHFNKRMSLPLEEWLIQQQELRKKIDENKETNFISANILHKVGGLDISFLKEDSSIAAACLVVINFHSLEIIYKKVIETHLKHPYVSGFLAFREAPVLIDLVKEVQKENPECYPQLLCIDGNGILHPKGCGLASHIGVLLDIPTIGVAKNVLNVFIDDCVKFDKQFVENVSSKFLIEKGDRYYVRDKENKIRCCLIKLSLSKSKKPHIISVGYKIDIEEAVSIILKLSKYKNPEPIRQADILSHEYVKNVLRPKYFLQKSEPQNVILKKKAHN